MDAYVGGDPTNSDACRNEVGNIQAMITMRGVGAANETSLMNDDVDIAREATVRNAKEATEMGMVSNFDVDTTSAVNVHADDVENTNVNFISNAPVESRPRVGLKFTSLNEGFDFYNKYAWLCGFSVRKDTTRRSRTGVISMRILRCSKASTRNKKLVLVEPTKRKKVPLIRSCCPAKIVFNLNVKENTYQVTQFVETHDHVLCTPRKTNQLRSHKKLTEDHLNMITTLNKSGIGVARCIDFMQAKVGGPSHLGFSERDVQNALRRKRQTMFGSDVDALLRYFQTQHQEDPQFIYDVAVDENMQLQSYFWVDRKSQEDYMAFGDVICFDTTYKTNEHDMPFGLFVGVNHHMQTVLFGAGMLFGETIEDFKWLFQTWLEAMGGVQPKTIIIDQDSAIKQAIATIFPNAHHILGLWRIDKKLTDKLSHVIHKHPTFKATWNNCLYRSTSVDEYEKKWSAMIEDFNLQANSWLHYMYDVREMWIPAYTKGVFSAGMRTTGWSESMNVFFDAFITHRPSLMDFVNGYEKALEKQRKDEADADLQNINGRPVLKTKFAIEAAMAEIYTMKVFSVFQEEIEKSLYYIANLSTSEGAIQTWHISKCEKPGEQNGKMVRWNEDNMVALCPCMTFESSGIVCRHIITLFRFKTIVTMPSKHLLARWTRTAKSQFKRLRDLSSTSATYVFFKRWSFLRSAALSSPTAYEVVKECMEKATAKILELPKQDIIENAANKWHPIEGKGTGDVSDNFNFGVHDGNVIVGTLQDSSSGTIPSQNSQAGAVLSAPIRNQHKGRSSGRIKGHLEQPVAGKRKCHGCHKYVVGHDKRTCPDLRELTPTGGCEGTSEFHSNRGRGSGCRGGVK